LQYFSASSLTLGDASSDGGCERKWAYEKLFGKRAPETKAQAMGVMLHAQNEEFLKTGVNALGTLAMRGRHMLPKPGPDLMVEADIVVPISTALSIRDMELAGKVQDALKLRESVKLKDAPLKLLGIPFLGYIDLVHRRCTNQGGMDIEDTIDPPGTVEVIDWKTTSSPDWIKTRWEMSKTIQMTSYGKWVLEAMEDVSNVRLSHGYYITKGVHQPQKVSIRLLPEHIEKQWEHVEHVGRNLLDVVKEKDIEKIDGNPRACKAFGGCPHREYCSVGSQAGLAKFFGAAGAARIAAKAKANSSNPSSVTSELRKGGLLALGKKTVTTVTVPSQAQLELEMRKVAREEWLTKFPEAEQLWQNIANAKQGYPAFGGELAQMLSDLFGLPLVGGLIPGEGDLGDQGPFNDLSDLPSLAEEIVSSVDTRPPPVIVPPDAPAPRPETASRSPEVVGPDGKPVRKRGRPRKDAAVAPVMSVETAVAIDTAEEFDSGQTTEVSNTVAPGDVYVGKVAVSPSAMSVTTAIAIEAIERRAASPEPNNQPGTTAPATTFFYVDCTPSVPHTSFWPTVDRVMKDMAEEADLQDIRLAEGQHSLSFGRWKAALQIGLQMEQLPLGAHLTLDTTRSELSDAVVEAMRVVCQRQGAVFVRGVK
jgi:hypothetical protein